MSQPKVKEIFETMEYGPALEDNTNALNWLKSRKNKLDHYIGGKFINSKNSFETHNPANEEFLATVPLASKTDVDKAVKAARVALPKWQALSCYERSKYLYALARLVQKNARLLSVLETLDNGKPIRESRDIDIPLVARHFYHHAGWAKLLETEFPNYEACGVVGQVIPWNFPLLMLAWKIAPALAAGNTVVLKPAEFTPVTATLFAELCQKAGLPDGVVNIVHGDGSTGAAIVEHKDIDKIAFTGSTEVGRIIRDATAGTGKSLTLELGGKSPTIVFEDADLDSAVEGVVDGIWLNQGEVCCAGSRLLIQEGVAERMIEKLKARINTLRIGNPLDKTIDIGAVVDKSQMKRISALVKTGVDEGAELVQPDFAKHTPSGGCFYPPTMLLNVHPSSTVAETEIFGPVLSVMTFRTQDEAIQIANNTRYGLAASIWTDNINMALEMAPRIKSGVVWVNSTNMFDAAVGFGGYRESGFGREGGAEGMYAYLKPKYKAELKAYTAQTTKATSASNDTVSEHAIDRTPKMYIGGKQKRPDGNYSLDITGSDGAFIGQVGHGNRKDIRDAVEAADKAAAWSKTTHHLRAQILYYIAENLEARETEFIDRLRQMTGVSKSQATKEVQTALSRLFTYGAWCDKYDGQVHTPPTRASAVAMKEAIGNVGIICPDEAPLLGFISLVAPAITMGNRAVVLPSEAHPLAVTDLYQVFDTSDLPGGVVNIVTGKRNELIKTIAEHQNIDALWCFAPEAEHSTFVEKVSVSNLKQTWCNYGLQRDWYNDTQSEGEEFLRYASQVKNIWVPYGE